MIAGWDEQTANIVKVAPRDPASVMFYGGGVEMLRIAKDGFYVRGEMIPQTPEEARKVYRAFVMWLRSQGMAI